MVRFLTYFTSLIIAGVCQAQLVLRPVDHPEQHEARGARMNGYSGQLETAQQVLTLPFWEDFSDSGVVPDTNKWESGRDVFINSTLGQNPPSYKVATFDGLRSDGRAHNMSSNLNGPGDSLVSQPIDLSLVSAFNRNTVYLSFYWQVRGHGEIPDQGDSLRLQFLSDSNDWVTQWVITGGEEYLSEDFTQEILQVDGERFFHENFKFKFESFSSQRGPFDTWHIDYIYLNEDRGPNDIYYQDRSLSGAPTLLFAPYHEIPASHFFNSQEVSRQQIVATNLDSDPHPISYRYEIRNESTGAFYYVSDPITVAGFTGYNLGRPVFGPEDVELEVTGEPTDSVIISSSFIYNTDDSFLSGAANINNSITTHYTLHNYYAYDDGTAEFAAAINQLAGQVAMRYTLLEPDTITHVDIYFPNIAPEATGSTVDVIVWDRLRANGERFRQSHTVQAPAALNQFTRVKLERPVIARDTVYIGYQQFTDNFIGVGFDRNNASSAGNIFTNISDSWEQNNRLEGVLMIRPVFGSDTTSLLLNTRPEVLDAISVYPNPSHGRLMIRGGYDQLSLYNLSGQLLYDSGYRETHDLQFLQNGLYLLRIRSGNRIITEKVVLSR